MPRGAAHAIPSFLPMTYSAVESTMDNALEFEASLFGLLASTNDMKEGMAAFLERRKADFRGS